MSKPIIKIVSTVEVVKVVKSKEKIDNQADTTVPQVWTKALADRHEE